MLIQLIKEHPRVDIPYIQHEYTEFLVFAITHNGALRGVYDPKLHFSSYNSGECSLVVYETVNKGVRRLLISFIEKMKISLLLMKIRIMCQQLQ